MSETIVRKLERQRRTMWRPLKDMEAGGRVDDEAMGEENVTLSPVTNHRQEVRWGKCFCEGRVAVTGGRVGGD